MTELQNKVSAWNQLKNLSNSNNIAVNISYRKSNSVLINSEIRRINQNINNIPKIKRQIKITNKPTRSTLLTQLREINPNTTLKYRTSTIHSIQQEIFKQIKKKNNNIVNDIIDFPLIKFLKNPSNESSYTASAQQFSKSIKKLNIPRNYVLEMHFKLNGIDTFRILASNQAVVDMLNRINAGFDVNSQETHGSDYEEVLNFIEYNENVQLTWFDKNNYKKTNTAAYFKWFHKFQVWNEETKKYELKLDLTKYQIYTKNQKIDYEPCLIYSLIQSGVCEDKINQLRLNVFERNVSFKDLTLVSKQLDLQIELTFHDEKKNQKRIKTYNKESKNIVKLAVVAEHYFVNEMTNITASAITYFNKTKNETIYPMVYLKSYCHKVQKCDKFLTSYEVIRNIYNQREKWLTPITIENINNYKHVEKFESYDQLRAPRKACICDDDDECDCKNSQFNEYRDYSIRSNKSIFKGKGKKQQNPNENYDVIFVDLETFVDEEKGFHVPYCIGYQYEKSNDKKCLYGIDCVVEFLNSLTRNAVIITHNLAFDFRGFVDNLTKFQTPIETGTKLKHIQCKYKFNHLVFKDNCAFLPFKLSSLPKMFNLESGDKDVYPYEFINANNIESFIDIQEINNFSGYKKPFDSKTFYENCLKSNSIISQVNLDGSITELVDIKKYTIHYCNQDVSILKQSYLKFREQILEITKIDIITLISLPQLADDFFKSKGVYDGCYSISGIAQDFIRQCAIGGRVMTSNNEKWHIKHNSQVNVSRYDNYMIVNGTRIDNNKSEYTSTEIELIHLALKCKKISDFDAVSLYPSAMKRLDGYLKGLPKVLSEDECQTFSENKYDYYFVEIEILSVGIKRDFPLISIKDKSGIRDFTNNLEDNIFHVDKTTLQDLVKFQHITYRVLKGYKFTDGFNSKIVDIIENMFQERIKLKKEGNPLQQAYKLILNASYGKLIQKPIKTTKKFHENDYRNYVIRNAKIIESYQRINEKLILITMKKSIIQHYTACHLACQVLSMSKRIMNEVMCLAEDKKIKIFYQDTDSMHLYDKDVETLGKLFKVEYGRELIGEAMGQFHTDFEVDDDDRDKSYPITATESLFIAKKTYIDKLEYKTKSGEIKYQFHIRAKGIPSSVIRELDDNVMNTYMRLFDNESIEFDLSKACPLKLGKDYRVRNTIDFTRKMHCPNDKKNLIFN